MFKSQKLKKFSHEYTNFHEYTQYSALIRAFVAILPLGYKTYHTFQITTKKKKGGVKVKCGVLKVEC